MLDNQFRQYMCSNINSILQKMSVIFMNEYTYKKKNKKEDDLVDFFLKKVNYIH